MRVKINSKVLSVKSVTPCKRYGRHLLEVVYTDDSVRYFDTVTAEQAEASANEIYEYGRTDLTNFKTIEYGD